MKQRVLIVEDDRWQAELYRDILRTDFLVSVCDDARAAINSLDKHIPDLIVLDIMLPGSNGLALLQEVRSYEDSTGIPIILCSSVAISDHQKAMLSDFSPLVFISKAVLTPEKLLKMAKEQCRARTK